MSDGRAQNSGARGAGRKPKALEDDLRDRLQMALTKGMPRGKSRLDAIFEQLVTDCTADSFRIRHASRAMLYERLYGKTTPPAPDEGPVGDGTFIVRVPMRMSAEEWQMHVMPSEQPPSQ